jgi:G:T-mismatch repair DNA endonuclease (very short patch repair protein)
MIAQEVIRVKLTGQNGACNTALTLTMNLIGGPMAKNKILDISKSIKITRSQKMKALWADPVYRAKQAARKKVSPETRKKMSIAQKKLWSDPIYGSIMRKAASERISDFNKTDTARELRSASSSANWKNLETRMRMRAGQLVARAAYLRNLKPSDFEARCYEFLDSFGINYDKQHPVLEADTIPDAYIEDFRLCIFFDSEYWHSKPENKKRDVRLRNSLVCFGYKVMVIRCDHKCRFINRKDLEAVRRFLCRE